MAYAGRLGEAIAAYREALSLDPDYSQAHSRLAGAYAAIGQFDAAIAEEETVVRLARHSAPSLVGLAIRYADGGRPGEAEALLPRILAAARTQYIPPFALAQVYAKLGNADRTFECLERAYEERSNGMVYLNVDRVFESVRTDPRYHALLKRVGLVP
jgi:tetratricopeptide (TPR) repeat protein